MRLFILLVIISIISVNCARPPMKEFMDAKRLLEMAEDKDAKVYAKKEYEKAYTLLKKSDSYIKSKDYKEAIETINRVKIKSEEAALLAQKNKNMLKEEVSKYIDDTILSFCEIDEDMAIKYANNIYDKAEELINDGEEAFDSGDYYLAKERMALANIKIKRVKKYIEDGIKYERIKAEMELREKKRKEAEERRRKKIEFEKRFPPIHIVREGETLWSLAKSKKIYNDPFQWPLIYKANRDQIKNPLIIYPGQALKIPRNSTLEEIKDARKEAGAHPPYLPPKDAYIPPKF
jgi:tetratricopeptide (TPR) repeat protein